MNDARDWEFLEVVFEWGSGSISKTKGVVATEKPTGTMVGAKITATIGTGNTVEKSEVI